MGPYLRDLGVQHLEGVDLSSKMLEVGWMLLTLWTSQRGVKWLLKGVNSRSHPLEGADMLCLYFFAVKKCEVT